MLCSAWLDRKLFLSLVFNSKQLVQLCWAGKGAGFMLGFGAGAGSSVFILSLAYRVRAILRLE